MKKYFCDVCGEACEPGITFPINHKVDYGEAHNFAPNELKILPDKTVQPYIEVRAVFSIGNHRTGFNGPPDLCNGCMSGMIRQLSSNLLKGTKDE